MSVSDHEFEVRKLLDNPNASIYHYSYDLSQWRLVKEKDCTWRSTKYLVVLPQHKHLMEAFINGKLEVFDPPTRWNPVKKNITPDFEGHQYRVKPPRLFTIQPDSIELEKVLEEAEHKIVTGVITVSSVVLGDA